MKALASFIMRGRWQAIGVTLFFAMLPFLSFISAVAVALVALRKGWQESAFMIALLALLSAVLYLFGLPWTLFVMLGISIIPVWLLALVLRATVSLGLTLQVGATAGAVLILLIYGFVDDVTGLWERLIMQFLSALGNGESGLPLDNAEQMRLATDFAQIATGIQVASLLLWSAINVLLARWGQSLLYHPGGFQKEFHALRLNVLSLLVFAVCLGAAMLWPVMWNVVWVLGVPFVLAGIALVHSLANKQANASVWLVIFYIVLLMMLPYMLWVLLAFALIDTWVDFRKRMGSNTAE